MIGQAVAAQRQALPRLNVAVDGDGRLFALSDCVDGKLRSGKNVAAREDIRLRGLIGDGVRHHAALFVRLQLAKVQALQVDALADGRKNGITFDKFVSLAAERGDLSVFPLNGFRLMLEEELDPFFLCLGHFVRIGGHVALLAAVGHRNTCAEAHRGTGDIHGDIAAADDDDLLADGRPCAGVHFAQEVDSAPDTLQVLARDAESSGLLGTDGEIDGVIALLTQLLNGDVLSDLDAAAEDHAKFLEHVDLGVQHGLLQTEGRDSVAEHTAGKLVFVKHRHAIVVRREEVGAAQAGRAGTDHGDLLVAEVIELLGDEAGVTLQLAVGDKLLHLVDGNGAVQVSSGAFALALAVADPAADGGQRVFFLDQLQRLEVSPLGGKLQIALNGDMRGTCGLAGGRAFRRNIFAVGAVVGVPVLRRPLDVIGKLMGLVLNGRQSAELLAHLDGIVGAAVGALAAGDALFVVDLGHVVALGGSGGVVILGHTEGQAALRHAVADRKGLPLMQGRDLMDTAAVLGFLQKLLGLGNGHGTALAGVVEHIAHMAHEDAEALVQIAASFVHHAADPAALARRHAQVAFVLLDVLAAALVIDLLGVRRNRALHRDHAHDAGAHRGVGGMLDLAGGRMLVEGVGNLRMCDAELLIDEQEFKNAGGIGRQQIDFQPHLGNDDLDAEADVGDLVQNFSCALHRHARLPGDHRNKAGLHACQRQHDRDLLVGDPLFKDLVFRAVGRDLIVSVVDLFTQTDQVFSDFHVFSPS